MFAIPASAISKVLNRILQLFEPSNQRLVLYLRIEVTMPFTEIDHFLVNNVDSGITALASYCLPSAPYHQHESLQA